MKADGTLVSTSGRHGPDRREDESEPAAEVNRLRTQIDATRDELGTYISEFDRRRHEALDLRLQIRKHPGVLIGVGVAIAASVTGALVMVARARKRETPGQRVQRAAPRILPAPPATPVEPSGKLKHLLKAALPIGVALAKGYLAGGRARRSQLAGWKADGLASRSVALRAEENQDCDLLDRLPERGSGRHDSQPVES